MAHHATPANPKSMATRRREILALLNERGECSIDQLTDRFGVSGMTIRRDLQDLADQGDILRTHGGAAATRRISFDFQFLDRMQHQAEPKKNIADRVFKLITPGQSIMLDSGTTTLAIANRLRAIGKLTLVTTSLPIASALFGADDIEVVLLGGSLRQNSPDLTGAVTLHSLDLISTDLAFIGADAIDEQGNVYNQSQQVGLMLQKMMGAARETYLVADHSKFAKRDLMRFGHVRDFTGIISDNELPAVVAKQIKRAGGQLHASANKGTKS